MAEPVGVVAGVLLAPLDLADDWEEAGAVEVSERVDDDLEGGLAAVDEFLELDPLEASVPDLSPPLALAASEPVALLGVVPVLATAALDPVEIGGELEFMIIDCGGPKQTLSLVFGIKFP